ncbi:hypothetical protein [Mucilaginibacter sp. UYCu711]|uniref:hypothetical protein n=1 Tax=Mucilaginibacter sp. UYCu711 TaxID=3156339 RepID=UPI003D1E7F09
MDNLARDQRVTVWHFSIYVSLFNKWAVNDFPDSFPISRSEIMARTHIGSIVTYHKCIRQLRDYGYIIYRPSYNPFNGSWVTLLVY